MKIYFTSSIRGTQNKDLNFKKIYDVLEVLGYDHLDNTVINYDINKFYKGDHVSQTELYKKTHENINRADVVILEVSMPSLSMGYVLHKSLDALKPVILLYKDGFDPYFAMGIQHDKLQVIKYDDSNLEHELKAALQIAQDKSDVRFNFFISPSIGKYLDWISKVKKIPRSVYLRALIERDMNSSREYSESEQ